MQALRVYLIFSATASILVPGCHKSQTVAQVNNPSTNQVASPIRIGPAGDAASRFEALYAMWRARHIDVQRPVINGFLPAYTKNAEFKSLEALGEPALPAMECKLRSLLDGTREYSTTNWCDICLVYAIVHIKKWDSYEVAQVGTNDWVDMDAYGRRVLDRLASGSDQRLPDR